MAVSHYGWNQSGQLPTIGAHSLAKHEIFERYIGIYIDKLTHTWSQERLNLTIVDGFCGGGSYKLGDTIIDGSPLRLLAAVDSAQAALAIARAKGFHINIDFHFVDEKKAHLECLRDLLVQRGFGHRIGADVHLTHKTFEEAYPEIRDSIKAKGRANRSLFFLDQYGWSDVRLGTIRNILSELRSPEIMLTFAVDALIQYLSDDPRLARALLDIDIDREDVRDLMAMRDQDGWRYLMQNGIYARVCERTRAKFYTPFFIRSAESNRSYWLLHFSNHRQARDEMGKLHWAVQNSFSHHGGPGLNALGFDPSKDLRQLPMSFTFDDNAERRSEAAVLDQLPRLVHASISANDSPPTVEHLFAANCNDTPVTSEIVKRQLLLLREEKEIIIFGKDGKPKPRAVKLGWDDRIVMPAQRSLLSRFK